LIVLRASATRLTESSRLLLLLLLLL
jgi:hypothetical protein